MRNRGALLGSVMLIILTSMLVGAGTTAYFFDVERAGPFDFQSGTLDLELGETASLAWATPKDWAPGDNAEVSVDLHIKSLSGTGIPAKSLIVHIFVDETGDRITTEPEEKVGGQLINDLDSVITIKDVQFDDLGDGDPAVSIIKKLRRAGLDKNGDGELKLSEIVCHEWDVLKFAKIDEMVPTTWYRYRFIMTFKFEEDAGNEYQGDYCKMSIEFMANQIKWKPKDTWCISVDGFIDENEDELYYWFEGIDEGVDFGFAIDNKFAYLAFIVEEDEPTYLYAYLDTKPGGVSFADFESFTGDYEIVDPDQSMLSFGLPCYFSKWLPGPELPEGPGYGWSEPHEWLCEGFVGAKNWVYLEDGGGIGLTMYEFKIPLECIEFVEFPYMRMVLDVGGEWYEL